ncbi:MAG: metallophosphoesterase [Prevotella sp.]|nr:metallophosphoesterase [Prevotella sp.]
MIARAFLMFVAVIVLPDLSIYQHCISRCSWRWKMVWWLQTLAMLVYTCWLAIQPDFTPHPQTSLNIYLFIFGVYVIPKLLIVLCAVLGRGVRMVFHSQRNWGFIVGCLLAVLSIYVTVYGSTIGFNKFEVKRVEFSSPKIPKEFDGYRIVLFSDAHVGSFTGNSRKVLTDAVDSMLAMKPDAIFFLGDIQNTRPEEMEEHVPTLSRLKATDGVFSILGNHDYSKYLGGTMEEKLAAEERTKKYQRDMGWHLLLNEHFSIHHGKDSIVLAGMQGNEQLGVERGVANYENTIAGIEPGAFTIMLAHNPKHWRTSVVPYIDAPLTVSGHTHGGQIRLFGLSTTTFGFTEDYGMYELDGKKLYVTAGLGALIPLRYNVTGEVVLLTLHKE